MPGAFAMLKFTQKLICSFNEPNLNLKYGASWNSRGGKRTWGKSHSINR